MANVSQVYAIVNAATSQAMGKTAITVVDTSTLIALGDSVLSSETSTDLFLGALVDRIGKTVFSIRSYQTRYPDIVKDPFEYGCVTQKIYVEMPEVNENKSWEIGSESFVPEYAPVIKPTVKQKLFNKMTTWEIAVTIPDFMLKTAFKDATEMAVLISGIFIAMDNKMEMCLESCVDLTRASFIARKISGAKPCGSKNLLLEYNTLTNETLTVDTCLRNLDFLKWASMTISIWLKRMSRMSVLFNDEAYQRHTPNENLVFTVLEDFASATNTFLQSDTYHNELTKLPNYYTVPYWQGSGPGYSFDDTSKIIVKLTAAGSAVTYTGVLAVAYDSEAMGVSLMKRYATTDRNNRNEYTDYFNKATMGYFNDMSENGMVFYVADPVVPEP